MIRFQTVYVGYTILGRESSGLINCG